MRKPSEYVAAAKARLRGSLMPDCSAAMRHGDRMATVTRVGSPSVGDDPLTGEEPAENCRVLAMSADFPELARGEAVELDNTVRIVTSCRRDIVGAGYSVGLSAPFELWPASYSGTRREAGRVCTVKTSFGALVLETGTADVYGDTPAPMLERTFTVMIRFADWSEVTEPEPSDTMEVSPRGAALRLNVATVTKRNGWFVLKCRTRGGVR